MNRMKKQKSMKGNNKRICLKFTEGKKSLDLFFFFFKVE